ncbi:MAG: helix-turn-helix transcriptional regulator [Rhodospirillales bacterium]|nr:helix-turn-helix transcriptional regulator [Rhodospirillales bacterium]
MTICDDFARRLARSRRLRGLSQRGLADLLKVERQTISEYERGRARPSPERAALIESVLAPEMGCSCPERATARGDPPANPVGPDQCRPGGCLRRREMPPGIPVGPEPDCLLEAIQRLPADRRAAVARIVDVLAAALEPVVEVATAADQEDAPGAGEG